MLRQSSSETDLLQDGFGPSAIERLKADPKSVDFVDLFRCFGFFLFIFNDSPLAAFDDHSLTVRHCKRGTEIVVCFSAQNVYIVKSMQTLSMLMVSPSKMFQNVCTVDNRSRPCRTEGRNPRKQSKIQ